MSPRTLGSLLSLVALVTSLHPWARARAEAMDVVLSRLSRGDCAATLGAPLVLEREGRPTLEPDQHAFDQLVTQLGGAIAPVEAAPVVTSGPGGFDVALESSLADIDERADAWQRGTRGRRARETCAGRNEQVSSRLIAHRLRFRKGLPLGLALGASVGKVQATGIYLFGVDASLALLEEVLGSRVPDLALRAALTRPVGVADLAMYVATFDVVMSERIVVGQRVELSPFLGAGILWTRAAAALVDLTPNIDALACREGTDPVCNEAGAGASEDDLAHDAQLAKVSTLHGRAFGGLWVRHGHLALAGSVTSDVVSPRSVAAGTSPRAERQWTVTIAPAVTF